MIDKLNDKYPNISFCFVLNPSNSYFPSPYFFDLQIWVNLFHIERPDMIINIHNVVARLNKFQSENNIKVIDGPLYYQDYQQQIDNIELLLERYIAAEGGKETSDPRDYSQIKNLLQLSIIEKTIEETI